MSANGVEFDHRTIALEWLEAVPADIDAGAGFTLVVRVTAPPEFDLSKAALQITAAENGLLTGRPPQFIRDGNLMRIALAAPEAIGEFAWRLVMAEHRGDGIVWRETSLPFSFRTRPHPTSLAVWDCPSPVVIGETFRLKVGLQCSAGCATLRTEQIEIHDEADAVVAGATLSATPWPQTDALYWAEVTVTAPDRIGQHTWTVKFSPSQQPLPHSEAAFAFGFITDSPPEHVVIVEVVEEGTEKPLENARLRLGAYRQSTDATGLTQFAVPRGEHELSIWMAGYAASARTLDVRSDARIRIAAKALASVNPDFYWQG